MKNHILHTAIAVMLFVVNPGAVAQLKLEIIPLKFRTTDQIIPVIKPLVAKGGTVTGMNNQLIIKTTAANLAEIKKLLRTLDKAPRRLMITVRQDIDGTNYRDEQSVTGEYSSGNVTIRNTNRRQGKGGTQIAVQDDDGNNVRYRTENTRSSLEDKNDFRIQTVEGQPAFIATGQSVPVANQNAFVTPRGGVVLHDTVEYRDVTSGFYVVPNVNGEYVTLLVSPELSRVNPHQGAVFDIQNIETTVQGRLGEWLEIGGVAQDFNNNDRGNLYSTRRRGQEARSVLIKVDEIP